jgi:hypothetical protein
VPAAVVQSDFSAGELAPRVTGRSDLPLYGKGLALCRNFMPLAQGALVRRNGTQDICAMADDTGYRTIEFRTSKGLRYVIGLGHQALRIFDESGDVYGSGGDAPGPELVTNGDFSAGATGWTPDEVARVDGGIAYVGARLEAELELESHTWLYQYFQGSYSQDVTITEAAGHKLQVRVTSLPTNGRLRATLRAGAAAPVFSTYITAPGLYVFDVNVTPGVYTLRLAQANNPESTAEVGFDDVSLYREGLGTSFVAPWTRDQVAAIHWVLETGADTLRLFHPNVQPQKLTRDALGNWSLAAVAGGPVEWVGTNWPGTAELYQGRLWCSGTPGQPSQVWASVSGSLEAFTGGVGDAAAFTFKAQTKGAVRWLRGFNPAALIIGTDVGEYRVTAQGGVLIPSDFQVEYASAYGSGAVQALVAGDRILYVSQDGKRIREMGFEQSAENWVSHDLSFLAGHLIAAGVKELHATREPIPLVVALLGTGELRACTYDRMAEAVAWWRFDTSGVVRSCCVLNGPDGSTVWASVERPGGLRLEKWTIGGDETLQVDAWVKKAIPENLTITGLDHLTGVPATILIDGALEAEQEVVAGEIVLERTGTEVVVGLAFSAKATGLPPLRDGKGRLTEVGVQVVDSALPLINGVRPPDRTPSTPQDTPEALRIGRFKVSAPLGWEEDATFEIEQDLPYRTEVVAVIGTVQVNR